MEEEEEEMEIDIEEQLNKWLGWEVLVEMNKDKDKQLELGTVGDQEVGRAVDRGLRYFVLWGMQENQ